MQTNNAHRMLVGSDEWVLSVNWGNGWMAHNAAAPLHFAGGTLDELTERMRECDYPSPTIELGPLRLRWSAYGFWELTTRERRYLGNAPTIRDLAECFPELGDAYGQYL